MTSSHINVEEMKDLRMYGLKRKRKVVSSCFLGTRPRNGGEGHGRAALWLPQTILPCEGRRLQNKMYITANSEELLNLCLIKTYICLQCSIWHGWAVWSGLVELATPQFVHPKSNFRPCMRQYALQQEAIDDITPVFKSLLKAGVIVKCDNSLVHTLTD